MRNGFACRKKRNARKRDLYQQVRREKRIERKEYQAFCERLTKGMSLTGDVAGEMLVYLAGRHSMAVRNFTSVTEYTANRIRIKAKSGELCIEGNYLRMEYFLPEEVKIEGDIKQVWYPQTAGEPE